MPCQHLKPSSWLEVVFNVFVPCHVLPLKAARRCQRAILPQASNGDQGLPVGVVWFIGA